MSAQCDVKWSSGSFLCERECGHEGAHRYSNWHWEDRNTMDHEPRYVWVAEYDEENGDGEYDGVTYRPHEQMLADAKFIAESRTLVEELIGEVEYLRGVIIDGAVDAYKRERNLT